MPFKSENSLLFSADGSTTQAALAMVFQCLVVAFVLTYGRFVLCGVHVVCVCTHTVMKISELELEK